MKTKLFKLFSVAMILAMLLPATAFADTTPNNPIQTFKSWRVAS